MKSHDFLHFYKQRSNPIKVSNEPSDDSCTSKETTEPESTEVNVTEPESRNGESNKSTTDTSNGAHSKNQDQVVCELERRRSVLSSCSEALSGEAANTAASQGAGFFSGGWRGQLCRCDGCRELYRRSGVEFLLEESDPVSVYEGKAERRPTTLDAGMAALGSSLDRVQQVEAFHRKYVMIIFKVGRKFEKELHIYM